MTKVLVADDDPDVLQSTARILEHLGHVVVPVQDGREVLAAAVRESPQIILQDVNMPGLDTRQLMRDLRAQPTLSDVRILLFTGDVAAQDLGHTLGADGVLEKPFGMGRIKQVIEEQARR